MSASTTRKVKGLTILGRAAPAAPKLQAAPPADPKPATVQKPVITPEIEKGIAGIKKRHNQKAAAALAAAANAGNPVAPTSGANPTSGAAPGRLNAGDPTEIDNTIAQMRCTVCQSLGIINKALGKTETPCNNCGAVAAAPASIKPKMTNANRIRLGVIKAAAASAAGTSLPPPPLPNINNTVGRPSFPPPPPLNASASASAAPYKGPIEVRVNSNNNTGATAPRLQGSNNGSFAGGRRSRRRHHKTSRRTKNKRYTRRR
jgi:hypothetical protein